jgi:hypothetical protein
MKPYHAHSKLRQSGERCAAQGPHRSERPGQATVRKRLRWVNSRLNEALVPLNAELSHNAGE